MSKRINRDQMIMEMAIIASKRTTCLRRNVGVVISLDGRPITIGYAGAPPGLPHCTEVGCLEGPDGGCIRTTHAEVNAIAFAARKGIALEGSTLYTTVSPCYNCAKQIITAGIKEVQFLEMYRNSDAFELFLLANIPIFQTTFQL